MQTENNRFWKLDTERVKGLMTEQQLKRWWVAETAGIHKTTLRRWLSGRIARVQDKRLRCFAAVLNVPHENIAQRCA